MRAIRIHMTDDQRRLQLDEVPAPAPRPDQVIVHVAAVSLNRADLGRGRVGGAGSNEPAIPGLDVAGVVESVGEEVTAWKPGDRVMALVTGGAYAEYCPARAALTYAIPEGMSFAEASTIPCVFLTAYYALTTVANLQRGETALIHAAGSGVGSAGIQIARALGARVITSAGSDAKVTRGLELGAEAGVNYSREDLRIELLRLTDERGVDIVLDPVGGDIYAATLGALAPGGRVVTIGGTAGPRAPADEAALQAKGQSVRPMMVFNAALEDSEGRGAARLNAWFEDGTLRPVIDRVLPMTQAAAAQRLLADRRVFGKVVLVWED